MAKHPCVDCGIETLVVPPQRRRESQWYMVTDETWDAAGLDRGYMCIDCLELRLGRPLEATDLADLPINIADLFDDTPQLRELKLAWMQHRRLPMSVYEAFHAIGNRY